MAASVPAASRARRRIVVVALAVAMLASLALHLRGIGGAFLSDDFSHLNAIFAAGERGALGQWLVSRFHTPLDNASFAYRPIAFASYALDWLLFGATAAGWHVTNLLLYGANAALAGALVAKWLGRGCAHPRVGATMAACMLTVYPFGGEISFWPVGRFDLLAALFSLLYVGTLAMRRWAAPPRQALCAFWLLCALLSKESAMPLPAVATILCFAAAQPANAPMTERLVRALRETWLSWLVFGVYLGWRHVLFGSFLKVYPQSPFPSSLAEYLERVATFRHIVVETIGPAHAVWSIAASIAAGAFVAAGLSQRTAAPVHVRTTMLALAACALLYATAPALAFPVSAHSGEGGRHFYLAWVYLSLLAGLIASCWPRAWLPALALALAMAAAHARSLAQWQEAAAEMKRIVASIEGFAERIRDDQYALILLPDHRGVALFARNAQGGIVSRPSQPKDYLDRVAPMVGSDFATWTAHIEGDTIARLKKAGTFDARNFVGLFCWNPAQSKFVQLTPGTIHDDARVWRDAAARAFGPAGCMAPFD